jgi:hypothetical protein
MTNEMSALLALQTFHVLDGSVELQRHTRNTPTDRRTQP